MAGEITETGELYSSYVGLVYMFNLIVGTGALTMPKAFATAGWLVSLVLLVFLGFMSFVTTTFVIEAMAAANAQLRWKRMENLKEEEDDDSSTASDSDVLIRDNYERAEKRPILSVQKRGSPNPFEITDRVEMGQMASMFFNKEAASLVEVKNPRKLLQQRSGTPGSYSSGGQEPQAATPAEVRSPRQLLQRRSGAPGSCSSGGQEPQAATPAEVRSPRQLLQRRSGAPGSYSSGGREPQAAAPVEVRNLRQLQKKLFPFPAKEADGGH
ncbi:transmembrane protein 104 isoform X7 [Macaca fascicularis]|uniref:transmembrane protein 104 isoform X7 n=1 Tax=Macaca fascicularis TaxID=9541 RepID=UPI003D15B091